MNLVSSNCSNCSGQNTHGIINSIKQGEMQEEKISEFNSHIFSMFEYDYGIAMNELEAFLEISVNNSNAAKLNEASEKRLYLYTILPLAFFCIMSVAVNIKILVCVYWIRKPISPTLHISLSLAAADAFSSTANFVELVVGRFIPLGLGFDFPGADCFLMVLGAIHRSASITAIGHLATLSVNHYLGIIRPLHYLSIMTHRMTTFITIVLWTFPLCFVMAYFNLVENEGFQSPGCNDTTFLFKKKFRVVYSSLIFGPFVLMVCIYAHIFHIVRRHQASRLQYICASSSFSRSGNKERESSYQQLAKNVKAIHTTLFILGSFVVGLMPSVLAYVLICEDCIIELDRVIGFPLLIIYVILSYLSSLKTLVNPIIYAARIPEIQVATKRMHSAFCGLFGFGKILGERTSLGLQSSERMSSR